MSAKRLLLIDDESSLLDLLRRYLERVGYEVETCADPRDAISRFDSDHFAMVVTDFTLPGMNGEELIRQLRQKRPDVPALIVSGYPYQPVQSRVGFLQKPFLPKMLLEAIEKELGSA